MILQFWGVSERNSVRGRAPWHCLNRLGGGTVGVSQAPYTTANRPSQTPSVIIELAIGAFSIASMGQVPALKVYMTNANQSMAFSVLNKFATQRTQLIEGMKQAGYTLESSRNVVVMWACDKTGCAYRETDAGKCLLDSGHAKYAGAKTTVRDVMLMLAGTTRRAVGEKKEVDLVKVALKALSALSAAQLRKVLASF